MDHSNPLYFSLQYPSVFSRENMKMLFNTSIMELYFANQAVGKAFREVKEFISSPQLEAVLLKHHEMQLRHRSRLEHIFNLHDRPAEEKACQSVNAILSQATNYLVMFSDDVKNFEVALLLTSRKLAHYKIAAYGAAAHLALGLNYSQAATLLAIAAQEEEEYLDRDLNALTDEFLAPAPV